MSPRQLEILEFARSHGRVEVELLAERFQVLTQTIRKDLNALCEKGILHRIHGGALLSTGIVNDAYESRRTLAAEEKRRIGQKAASLITDNSSLILNIGTTVE